MLDELLCNVLIRATIQNAQDIFHVTMANRNGSTVPGAYLSENLKIVIDKSIFFQLSKSFLSFPNQQRISKFWVK